MALFLNSNFILCAALLFPVVFCSSFCEAAMDPRFELDPAMLSNASKSGNPAKTSHLPSKEKIPAASGRRAEVYTVKSGDNLFKILMHDFNLSNQEAESFIEEIRRENNIYDIKRLKIGQKIIIPKVRRRADGSLKLTQPEQTLSTRSGSSGTPGQSFTLESPVRMFSEQEAVGKVRDVWDRIVPVKPETLKPFVLQTPSFSLTLDAQRYPSLSAMDGGRILLDQGGTIPQLVKSLIHDKDPSIKIVSETPLSAKKFISALLDAGGFYSVEENFSMDFGVDPKLSFRSDFKVEKSPESLIKQDVVLMNSGLDATPPALREFLKKEGFSLYEPFASLKPYSVRKFKSIQQITATKQPELVDSILKALAVPFVRDRRIDVFAADNNGISLAVKSDRYFERGGQRYVITNFDGDPVNYTLFRILETKGFRVVILQAQDDFRKVSEKILSGLRIKGTFAKQELLKGHATGYTLQMSGFDLDDSELPDGGLFLTNLGMDPIIREVLKESGYNFNNR